MTPLGDQTAGPAAAPAVLAGRYERRHLLGAGGMGEVYQGHDRTLDRPVALKLLRPQFAADPVFVARFLREATAAARLSHPNVVAVYDAGSDGQTHYIVMEYIQGRTLRQELDEHGPLPVQRAVAIVSAIAAALQAAHAQGLIHRDVKPGNVMLTDDGQDGQGGQVKVVDFGIARVADAAPITQTAALLGTPLYLAPEQAQGGPPDARGDVYALGVCLYELLTGSPPFADGAPVAIAYRHIHERPRPPSELRADVPVWLESVVLTAMAKDPQARYQTAAAMRADLVRPAAADPTPIPPPTPSGTRTMTLPTLGTTPPPATDTMPLPAIADRRAGVDARSGLATRGVPGRRRRVVVLALAGVLLGGLLAVALPRFIGGGLEREPERAAAVPPARLVMPELRGLTVAAARTRLQALGVQRPPTVYRQFDGSVAAGRLASTDPPARTPITPDTRVSLIVSQGRGPDPVRSDQQRDNDAKSKDKRAEEKGKKEGKKGDGGKE